MVDGDNIVLDVEGLKKYFPLRSTGFRRQVIGQIKAVDDVTFQLAVGETVGVVGESGCGKTTLGRCIVRIYDPTAGDIRLRLDDRHVSVAKLNKQDYRMFRKSVQMVFQDPFASLNPRINVLETIGEPLLVNGIARGHDLEERVTEVIRKVGLNVGFLRRFPHSFSGGQRQRICIARALVVNPRVVVADEPVSALDVSIQAQILNLLQDLQREFGLSYVFISHNMSVVRYMSNRVIVMYAGKMVETAPRDELLYNPKHPYTAMLLSAVPKVTRLGEIARAETRGEPPNLLALPQGCVFSPRCLHAREACATEPPVLRLVGPEHYASCHYADELGLKGI
jgi:peptide/nickel transport system ATP-binding protein